MNKFFKNPSANYISISLFTIIFVYLILKNISVTRLTSGLLSIGPFTFLLCLAIHFSVYYLRTVSMWIFLKDKISIGRLLLAHFVHNFYLSIFPASLGELSLPILIENQVPKSRTLSILVMTRFLTMFVILCMFIVSAVILFHGFSFLQINGLKAIWILIFISVLMIIIYVHRSVNLTRKFRVLAKIWDRVIKAVRVFWGIVLEELSITKALLLMVTLTSYILLLSLFYQVVLKRLDLNLSILQLSFVISIQAAMLVLPIKSIGGFGTVEGSWMFGFMLLGFSKEMSLESGIIVHIVNLASASFYFVIGLIGLKLVKATSAKSDSR